MTMNTETVNSSATDNFIDNHETALPETGVNEARAALEAQISQQTKPTHFHRSVPHQALHAEREEHKKTRAALAELRAQHEQMMTQLGKRGADEISEATMPDPREDFLEFTRWQADKQQRLRQEAEDGHLWQQWQQSCELSQAELPDLEGALNFLSRARDQQLKSLSKIDGRFQNEQNRIRQMQQEWRDLVKTSLNNGQNPARLVYELARAHGYESGKYENSDDGADSVADAIARLRELDEAQKAARTLASSNGREAGDPLLLENLSHLSEAEFARWYENNPDSFRRLFAG